MEVKSSASALPTIFTLIPMGVSQNLHLFPQPCKHNSLLYMELQCECFSPTFLHTICLFILLIRIYLHHIDVAHWFVSLEHSLSFHLNYMSQWVKISSSVLKSTLKSKLQMCWLKMKIQIWLRHRRNSKSEQMLVIVGKQAGQTLADKILWYNFTWSVDISTLSVLRCTFIAVASLGRLTTPWLRSFFMHLINCTVSSFSDCSCFFSLITFVKILHNTGIKKVFQCSFFYFRRNPASLFL